MMTCILAHFQWHVVTKYPTVCVCRIEAEQYLQTVSRTWAIWIGIGDYQTQRFDLVDYSQKESIAYTDVTAPSLT